MKTKSGTPNEFHSRQRPVDEAAVGARQRLRLCAECFLISARGGIYRSRMEPFPSRRRTNVVVFLFVRCVQRAGT